MLRLWHIHTLRIHLNHTRINLWNAKITKKDVRGLNVTVNQRFLAGMEVVKTRSDASRDGEPLVRRQRR